MAFKTDTIKLKLYTGSDPTADNGELAIVDNVLRLKSNGSWADVSSSSGGGASQLSDLSDVLTSPSTEFDVPYVNSSSQLTFQSLITTLNDSGALDTESSFTDDNAHLMTSKAIKNKIIDLVDGYGFLTSETSHADVLVDGDFGSAGLMTTDGAGAYTITTNNSVNWNTAYVWGDHSSVGYVKNFTDVQSNLSSHIMISAAERNQKHIAMGDPSGFKYVLPVAAIAMNDNTIIEIINHSSYNQTLSTMNFHIMYLTNTQTQSTADIIIEKGQRALILPKPADNKYFVSILIA